MGIIAIFKEPYVALFLIMIVGTLLSKVSLRGISLGSSAIVIAALCFGHFGFSVPAGIETIGLILFIFAVGIEAGPGFVDSFRTGEAKQYLIPVAIILTLVFTLSILMSKLLGLSPLLTAGVFSGITTSTATLAAIIENSRSNEAILTYTIAYPVSLITTIITIRICAKILKINPEIEIEKYKNETARIFPKIFSEYFVVENPSIENKTLEEISISKMTNAHISRIQKGNESFSTIPLPSTKLNKGDLIKATGDSEAIEKVSLIIGQKSNVKIKISSQEEIASILVTNPDVIGKRLKSLNLDELWGAEITQIRRAGIALTPSGDTKLRFADKVLMTVKKETAPNLIRMLGGLEPTNINFLPIALSIIIGVIIGQIKFEVAGTFIGPGVSGGILFATLFLGRLGKTGPLLWSIAGQTNQYLRQLGLMFFLCGVGAKTGNYLVQAISDQGLHIAYMSALISFLTITVASFIIVKYQNLNRLKYLGAVPGALTCAAALPSLEEVGNSSIPLSAYSITYPFALIFTIFLGQLIMLIV